MSAKQEWLDLAERCEKVAGPDREIDVMIGLAIDWKTDATKPLREVVSIYGGPAEFVARCIGSPVSIYSHDAHMPRWTESLDAITALIERELLGWAWTVYSKTATHGPRGVLIDQTFRKQVGADGATPALALCAAFCRAMAERAEK